jgi:hypothetical protein
MVMNKLRSDRIVVYLEPFLASATTRLCDREKRSYSEYIRSLVIKDLKERQLLTDAMIAEHLC